MSLSELLLYGLIIAGVIVFNYITQQAAQKRRREEARREAEQRAEAMAPVDEAGDYAWGRRPTTVPARTEEAARYEWGGHPEAIAVPPAEYSSDERRMGEPALSREELQAREARARREARQQPRTLRRSVEARRLFATRKDLHRAVIAMTVLGPCRAIEPPELRDASRTVRPSH